MKGLSRAGTLVCSPLFVHPAALLHLCVVLWAGTLPSVPLGRSPAPCPEAEGAFHLWDPSLCTLGWLQTPSQGSTVGAGAPAKPSRSCRPRHICILATWSPRSPWSTKERRASFCVPPCSLPVNFACRPHEADHKGQPLPPELLRVHPRWSLLPSPHKKTTMSLSAFACRSRCHYVSRSFHHEKNEIIMLYILNRLRKIARRHFHWKRGISLKICCQNMLF